MAAISTSQPSAFAPPFRKKSELFSLPLNIQSSQRRSALPNFPLLVWDHVAMCPTGKLAFHFAVVAGSAL